MYASNVWPSWSAAFVTLATWAACGVADCNCKKTGYGMESKIPAGVRTQFQQQDSESGTYSYGYDTGPEDPSGHFRQEERLGDGSVRGRYGYTDPNGLLKIVEYFADDSGFHILHVKTQAPKRSPGGGSGGGSGGGEQRHPNRADSPEPFGPFLGVLPPFLPKYKDSDAGGGTGGPLESFAVNEI